MFRDSRGFTLIELMIVIAIIAVIAAIAIPGLLAAQRSSNERNASASLKTLASAQADFRSNDRDGDRQVNFWTGNVYALYALTPSPDGVAGGGGVLSSMIKLIEPAIAGAEGASLGAVPAGIVPPLTACGLIRQPKAGYVYTAFTTDEFALPYNTPVVGIAYNPFHNFGKFAFLAMPTGVSSGKSCFLINEDNTIWKGPLHAQYSVVFDPIWANVGLNTINNMTVTGPNGAWNGNATGYPVTTWPGAVAVTGPAFPLPGFGFSKMD